MIITAKYVMRSIKLEQKLCICFPVKIHDTNGLDIKRTIRYVLKNNSEKFVCSYSITDESMDLTGSHIVGVVDSSRDEDKKFGLNSTKSLLLFSS